MHSMDTVRVKKMTFFTSIALISVLKNFEGKAGMSQGAGAGPLSGPSTSPPT